jgi:CHASE2 domain-containing sensor protein
VILGVLVSTRFRQPIRWTPALLVMLVASSGFGYLVLAHHWGTMAAVPVVGALVAFVAYKVAQLRAAPDAPSAAAAGDAAALTGPQAVLVG